MQAASYFAPPLSSRIRPRSALVVSADRSFGQRLSDVLTGLRWQVRTADSGSQAWGEAEMATPEAVITDSWLPDLEVAEFLADFRERFPHSELISASGAPAGDTTRGPHHQELLYALRRSQDSETASWNAAAGKNLTVVPDPDEGEAESYVAPPAPGSLPAKVLPITGCLAAGLPAGGAAEPAQGVQAQIEPLPELVGNAALMLEVSRRIRLVAPRLTPVLVEGPTGSGKELVAEALHRLSQRSRKPFVAINCAAIPEALLEAELFGHTRGAFTGAVQGRVGRIESADGGTLFLDEIGEMPLALQSKLLRFVESGELQRVGTNETVKVDVRIVAATHRPLAARSLQRWMRRWRVPEHSGPMWVCARRRRGSTILRWAGSACARRERDRRWWQRWSPIRLAPRRSSKATWRD